MAASDCLSSVVCAMKLLSPARPSLHKLCGRMRGNFDFHLPSSGKVYIARKPSASQQIKQSMQTLVPCAMRARKRLCRIRTPLQLYRACTLSIVLVYLPVAHLHQTQARSLRRAETDRHISANAALAQIPILTRGRASYEHRNSA